jgi:hypothetical protein
MKTILPLIFAAGSLGLLIYTLVSLVKAVRKHRAIMANLRAIKAEMDLLSGLYDEAFAATRKATQEGDRIAYLACIGRIEDLDLRWKQVTDKIPTP